MSNQRSSVNEESVRRLHAYLSAVRREPGTHVDDENLQSSLSSQGRLARFERPDAGITPMSLNTAKRAADGALEGGYAELDRMRLNCAEAVANARHAVRAQGSRETKKKSLRERAEAAEQQVDLLSEDLQLATGLIRHCLRQARTYAKRADAATQALCAREQHDVLRLLGLLRARSAE